MKVKTFIGVLILLMALVGMTACDNDNNSVPNGPINPESKNDTQAPDNPDVTESLYGEWWLVGWNDGGTWTEVDTNYVSHQHMSIEFKEDGNVVAWSMVNDITVGMLTLNGKEMSWDTTWRGSTAVGCSVMENNFFEKYIYGIKSYQLEGKQLKLFYTDNDYFVFTKDFDDSEEYRYAWKNGLADPYIGEVTVKSDDEVVVKIVDYPQYVGHYARSCPPASSSHLCHFAASDLASLSFDVGDKIAFRIDKFRRQKDNGNEYLCVGGPCKNPQHVADRTGTMYNDKRMGWIIIDDEKNEKECGIYYYPLKDLPEEYLADGEPVKFSGKLYPTWKYPSVDNIYSNNYYLDIEAIELVSPAGSVVAIDEENFPDEGFREWLAMNCKWANDGVLTEREIEETTSLEVSWSLIKSLKGIEYLTHLTSLAISCYNLEGLDISKNTELVSLDVEESRLKAIDLSNNTKLQYLSLRENSLKTIDLTKNTELEEINLALNQLTSLDLTGLKKLKTIYCYRNKISGEAMDALIASLSSECPETFCGIDTSHRSERNVITKSQVAAAKAKGWTVQNWLGGNPQEYNGSNE